jgi:hypothetical protein
LIATLERRIAVLAVAGALACGRGDVAHDGDGRSLTIALDTARGVAHAVLVVSGFSDAQIDSLRSDHRYGGSTPSTSPEWQTLLRVGVSETEGIPVAGKYVVTDSAIEFRPLFPFDLGRSYWVRVEPSRLPWGAATSPDSVILVAVSMAKPYRPAIVEVRRILPSGDQLPENLLRLYVEFTAPMSRQGAIPFVRLMDSEGKEVKAAFLPLDIDFWNEDRTRFTLFLDPGRVKQGILPNEQLGRALVAGRRYTIEIDSTWRDAHGVVLARPYRRSFVAGPVQDAPVTLAEWKIEAPGAGRGALVVRFPKQLDHGLLRRGIGVERDGRPVDGDATILDGEREWRFEPRGDWRRGTYHLVVLSILEDPMGNRIGRPFEVDMFEKVDSVPGPEKHILPFVVR